MMKSIFKGQYRKVSWGNAKSNKDLLFSLSDCEGLADPSLMDFKEDRRLAEKLYCRIVFTLIVLHTLHEKDFR